jgi:hypothetical protein
MRDAVHFAVHRRPSVRNDLDARETPRGLFFSMYVLQCDLQVTIRNASKPRHGCFAKVDVEVRIPSRALDFASVDATITTLFTPFASTRGVTIGECREQGLHAFADPLTAPPEKAEDPEHAVIYSARTRGARQRQRGPALPGRRSSGAGCVRPRSGPDAAARPLAAR